MLVTESPEIPEGSITVVRIEFPVSVQVLVASMLSAAELIVPVRDVLFCSDAVIVLPPAVTRSPVSITPLAVKVAVEVLITLRMFPVAALMVAPPLTVIAPVAAFPVSPVT